MNIPIKIIHHVVCNYLDIPLEQPFKKSRRGKYIYSRRIIFYFGCIYRPPGVTLQMVANYGQDYDGGKWDHATVLHSRESVEDLCFCDKGYREMIEQIELRLRAWKTTENKAFNMRKVDLIEHISMSNDEEDLKIKLRDYYVFWNESDKLEKLLSLSNG